MSDKPVLHALVAYEINGRLSRVDWLTLADAYQALLDIPGAHLLVDPSDEAALGKWEREQLPHNAQRWWRE